MLLDDLNTVVSSANKIVLELVWQGIHINYKENIYIYTYICIYIIFSQVN